LKIHWNYADELIQILLGNGFSLGKRLSSVFSNKRFPYGQGDKECKGVKKSKEKEASSYDGV
jgi:hypothetical protein